MSNACTSEHLSRCYTQLLVAHPSLIMSGNTVAPSLVDANGTYHFTRCSEVSLSQGLLMYTSDGLVSVGTVESVLGVLNTGVSDNRGHCTLYVYYVLVCVCIYVSMRH